MNQRTGTRRSFLKSLGLGFAFLVYRWQVRNGLLGCFESVTMLDVCLKEYSEDCTLVNMQSIESK